VTLGTLALAWLAAGALFLAWARLPGGLRLARRTVLVLLAEAAVLTLLAGLWFGSLGRGGWWLVFLLLGALVGGAERGLRAAVTSSPAGPEVRAVALGVARYLAAGALLAWFLG
jgi:hypothetical protein